MKSILITGATGFLGKHLIERLKDSEPTARLRLLCRRASPRDQTAVRGEGGGEPVSAASQSAVGSAGPYGVEVVRGDVTSREDVERAVEGTEEIYHVAGVVSRNPREKWNLYRTHVQGTQNICAAARKPGVRKVVVVSSSGTIAVSREPVVHDETSGYKHEIVGRWPYYLSKIFAEKIALKFAREARLPLVVVNPSLLLGPGDDRNSSTRDIALFLQGQILALPLGGLNFVDVRDVASGLIAAMRWGTPGERYLLGGANQSFKELVKDMAKISGVSAPRLQPSLRLSLWSARLFRRIFPLIGKSFALDDVSIEMSSLFWYCDSSKARSALGFKPRDPLETLRDTVEDLRRRMA